MAALERKFVARNEPGLPNAVHDDEFARRLGFRAGLVAGADLYGFMAELSAQALGQRWQETGALSARFNSPVYDGEEVADEHNGLRRTLDWYTSQQLAAAR